MASIGDGEDDGGEDDGGGAEGGAAMTGDAGAIDGVGLSGELVARREVKGLGFVLGGDCCALVWGGRACAFIRGGDGAGDSDGDGFLLGGDGGGDVALRGIEKFCVLGVGCLDRWLFDSSNFRICFFKLSTV